MYTKTARELAVGDVFKEPKVGRQSGDGASIPETEEKYRVKKIGNGGPLVSILATRLRNNQQTAMLLNPRIPLEIVE